MKIDFLFNDRHGLGQPVRYYLENMSPNTTAKILNCFDLIDFSVDQLIEKIKSSDFDLLIFHSCHHSYHAFHNIYTTLSQFVDQDKLLAITGNGNYYDSNQSNIVYYPYYWYSVIPGPHREVSIESWSFDPELVGQDRQYSVSCLNNRYSLHRLVLFDLLQQTDYFGQILYSLNQIIDENLLTDSEEKKFIADIRKKYLNKIPVKLDCDGFQWTTDMLGMSHPANTNTYLNVVTENSWDEPFISEKIFKPIACGQFFLLLSGTGTVELLRKLGFDVFDDYFDHSYDQESDLETRAKLLVKVIDNWMQADHYKIWSDTYHRRLANAKQFFNLDVKSNPFGSYIL
jgi:hypothetical protein